MASVTYVQPDGTSRVVEVPVGTSAMAAAVSAGVPGIVAECGGSLSCATCHVYVERSTIATSEISADEEDMLDWTASPRLQTSRLSCQLVVVKDDDEMTLRVPDKQL